MSPAPARRLFQLSIGVFFIGGFLSSLVNLFVPRLTLLYGLDYSQALLVQMAFHLSYLLFAIPIGLAVISLGYMRSAASGLAVMAVSTIGLLIAHGAHSYAAILLTLLALSAGITFLQIAANTVAAIVGDEGAVRLTLLQAFNAIGTVVAPLAGASFVLDKAAPRAGWGAAWAIAPPFAGAALVLVVLAIAFVVARRLLDRTPSAVTQATRSDWRSLAGDRRLIGGAMAIFVYVGAEVAIGALLVNYLVGPAALPISTVTAARLVSLYWAGAMIGRIGGAAVMRRVAPANLLVTAAIGAAGLSLIAACAPGVIGSCALIAVGLCNSIMYPTIYVLALPTNPAQATPGATILCMAVVGGAVIPLLTGAIADQVGLAPALILPACCYVGIGAFGRAVAARNKESLAWS